MRHPSGDASRGAPASDDILTPFSGGSSVLGSAGNTGRAGGSGCAGEGSGSRISRGIAASPSKSLISTAAGIRSGTTEPWIASERRRRHRPNAMRIRPCAQNRSGPVRLPLTGPWRRMRRRRSGFGRPLAKMVRRGEASVARLNHEERFPQQKMTSQGFASSFKSCVLGAIPKATPALTGMRPPTPCVCCPAARACPQIGHTTVSRRATRRYSNGAPRELDEKWFDRLLTGLVDTRKLLMICRCRAPALLAMFAVAACSERKVPPSSGPPGAPASADAQAATTNEATSGAGANGTDAGGYEGPWLGATVLQAPILSEMESERSKDVKVVRLGYLRYGSKVPVFAEPRKKANCPEGWYELFAGGFVCGKYATLDLEHPKFRTAHAPDLDSALPYTYGANVANGTPLYRSVPSRAARLKYEPWLVPHKKPKPIDDDSLAASGQGVADAGRPGGRERGRRRRYPLVAEGSPRGRRTASGHAGGLQENEGPISRRMVKGFFWSLDRQFPAGGTTWWRTVGGLVAPVERIFIAKPLTEYHGVWLGKDEGTYPTKNVLARRIDKLPVAFVMNGRGHRWTLDETHKHSTPIEGKLDHFQAVGLTGTTVNVAGYEFWETDED